MRVGRVERPDDLIVIAACLSVAQERDALNLDLLRVRLRREQRDGFRHKLLERHRELAVLLAGQQRLRYPGHDRDRQSRAQVANLRAAYGSMGRRSRAGELVRTLQKVSPEFARLWDRHEVAKRFEDHKTLIHPQLGAIELDCQVLFTEDQSQLLLVLTAPPRTEGYEKLQLLAVLGHQHFAEVDR